MDDMCAIQGASLAKRGWTFTVNIIADPPAPGDPPDQPQWGMDSSLKVGHDKLEFDKNNQNGMKKRDYYLIKFKLKDNTNLDLRFAPNPMIAFWVNWDTQTCPTDACYCDEVYAVCVEEDGDKLLVRNEDDTIADFAFSLGFLKGGFSPNDPNGYIRYDPIGSNKDGGL